MRYLRNRYVAFLHFYRRDAVTAGATAGVRLPGIDGGDERSIKRSRPPARQRPRHLRTACAYRLADSALAAWQPVTQDVFDHVGATKQGQPGILMHGHSLGFLENWGLASSSFSNRLRMNLYN